MTFIEEKFNRLNDKRRRIVITFHQMKVQNPHAKKHNLIRETAKCLKYALDKQNNCNSYVMRVVRQWENETVL